MYATVLLVHSWLRWAALLLGVISVITAFTDRGSPSAADRWSLFFMMVLDVQMLLGLLLYLVLSPITVEALKHMSTSMQNSAVRFWAVEHVSMMLLAVMMVHVGRVLARTAKTPESKRTRQIVCFTIATLAMIAGIPWPWMAAGRPLFPPFHV
jgi:heme A synthase